MCELWDEPQKELLERETERWDQAGSLVHKANAGVMGPPSSHCIPPNCALGLDGEVQSNQKMEGRKSGGDGKLLSSSATYKGRRLP